MEFQGNKLTLSQIMKGHKYWFIMGIFLYQENDYMATIFYI